MSLKVKGTPLFNSQFGGEQPIPAEFIAAMQRSEKVQPVPNDVGPDGLGDTVVESRVTTDQTGERMLHTVGKIAGNITLRAVNTDNNGQPVQVTRILHPTGQAPTQPTATTTVAVHDLGNGWSIEESSVEGTYVNGVFTPGIFNGNLYKIEIPEVIPLKFRAIVPILETDDTVVGVAQMPTLGVGDLMQSQEQVDEYKVRLMRSYRDLTGLPKSIVSYDTSDPKQVVTITETLQLATTPIAVPSATKTVSVENLGDGTVLQTQRDLPSVFPQNEYSAERPDVTPEDFRALLALTSVTISSPGTAVAPTLNTGDLEARDEQLTLFTHRTTVAHRSLPVVTTLQNQELYEGLPVMVARSLATGSQDLAPDYRTIEGSQMRLLGDGRSLMEKKTVADFYPRYGQSLDPTLGLPRPYVVHKVANSTANNYVGTSQVAIEPLDEVRSVLRDESVSAAELAALDAFKVSYGATIDYIEFPPVLTAINVEWQTSIGKGDNTENGQSTLNGSGTLQLELPESAQASASVIPNVTPTIQSIYARNITATDVVFFVQDNTTTAEILARAGALPWPVFQPVSHTVICKGQKVTVRANANARFALSLNSGGNSVASSAGSGGDQDTEDVTRAVTIPACIHGALSVGGTGSPAYGLPSVTPTGGYTNFPPNTGVVGATTLTSNTSMSATVVATATANVLAPNATATRTVKLTANGSVSPTAFAATPGISAIPTSGVYAYRVNVEPYRPGRAMVRVRIVDFALLKAHTGGTLTGLNGLMTAVGGTIVGLSGGADTPTPTLSLPAIDPTDVTLAPVPILAAPSQVPGANTGDSGSGNTTGTALTAPVITTQPASVYAAIGTSVSFSVVASGSGLTYQWYLGTPGSGTLLSGATGSTYIITKTVAGESGTYYAVVANDAGSVTSTGASLSVGDGTTPVADPRLAQQPSSRTYPTGLSSVTLTATAAGTAPFSYQWYDSVGGSATAIAGAVDSSVTINPAQLSGTPASHQFYVVVTNSIGSVTSTSATIAPYAPLPSVTFLRPLSGSIYLGSPPNGRATRIILGLSNAYSSDLTFNLSTNGYGVFSSDPTGTAIKSSITIPAGGVGATVSSYGGIVTTSGNILYYIASDQDFIDNVDPTRAKLGNVMFTATSSTGNIKSKITVEIDNRFTPVY